LFIVVPTHEAYLRNINSIHKPQVDDGRSIYIIFSCKLLYLKKVFLKTALHSR
jgi:hypothetical protein